MERGVQKPSFTSQIAQRAVLIVFAAAMAWAGPSIPGTPPPPIPLTTLG